MSHDIAFLHTAEVHVETFGKLVADIAPEIAVRHEVRSELLAYARENGVDARLSLDIQQALKEAASSGARIVVCTCSTIGGVAEAYYNPHFRSMRLDRAMADIAVAFDRVLVLAALESTLEPSQTLLQDAAKQKERHPQIECFIIVDAWQYFTQGRFAEYYQCVADIIQSEAPNYDAIVLAQGSMGGAAELCDVSIPVLSSPRLGVEVAIAELKELGATLPAKAR